jgi:hypothetical protein
MNVTTGKVEVPNATSQNQLVLQNMDSDKSNTGDATPTLDVKGVTDVNS